MATLQEMIDRVDSFLSSANALFLQKQRDFYAQNGRFWQGLSSHTTPPNHTASADGDAPADNKNTSPHYQGVPWVEFMPEYDGVSVPCSITVNQYIGPQGAGVEVIRSFSYEGTKYVSVANYGPETYRDRAWVAVE